MLAEGPLLACLGPRRHNDRRSAKYPQLITPLSICHHHNNFSILYDPPCCLRFVFLSLSFSFFLVFWVSSVFVLSFFFLFCFFACVLSFLYVLPFTLCFGFSSLFCLLFLCVLSFLPCILGFCVCFVFLPCVLEFLPCVLSFLCVRRHM